MQTALGPKITLPKSLDSDSVWDKPICKVAKALFIQIIMCKSCINMMDQLYLWFEITLSMNLVIVCKQTLSSVNACTRCGSGQWTSVVHSLDWVCTQILKQPSS